MPPKANRFSRRRLLGMSAVLPLASVGLAELAIAPTANAGPLLPSPPLPLLPQHDLAPWGRQAQLTVKKAMYVWTEQGPFLEGIPVAVLVPPDALPTIEWLLTGLDSVIGLGVNLLGSVIPQLNAAVTGTFTESKAQLAERQEQATRARKRFGELGGGKYNQPGARPGEDYPITPEAAAEAIVLQNELLGLFGQVRVILDNLRIDLQRLLATNQGIGDFGSKDGLAAYNSMWSSMPAPDFEDNIHDDELFAYMRVGGWNPMKIERVRGALTPKMPLTNAQFQQGLGDHADSLQRAIDEGRLFLIDYQDLGLMAPEHATYKILTGDGYNSAPIAVFAIAPGKKAIQVVAIQCGQDPSKATMFVRPDPADAASFWGWQMAKTVVQTADFNHHEMLAHLGRAHLVTEAFAVATHRTLAKTHPLNVLLVPHFEGEVFINFLAATIILPANMFGDDILAAPLNHLRDTVGKDRLAWDFYEHMPRTDFANRGVDDANILGEYPFRDDALLIWDTIHDWVNEYVRVYYRNDADVMGDLELAAWTQEVIDIGKIKGFRVITSVDQLVEVITMIVYTASAYHAAVNYPQSQLMAYAPFTSGKTSAPAPTVTTGHTEADWIKMLPSVFSSLAQFYFLNVLGSIYYRPLGDYRTNEFPYWPAITDPRVAGRSGPLSRFQDALKRAEVEIANRNTSRSQPYEYLLPSNIPTSTNI